MNLEIKDLKRTVDLHTRMEIPPRDVVDILLPRIMCSFRIMKGHGSIKDMILVILELNRLSDYLEIRFMHQNRIFSQRGKIANKMHSAYQEVLKGLVSHVEGNCLG